MKLQAATEAERDAWVAAIEAAKLKAWSSQEENAFSQLAEDARRASPSGGFQDMPAQPAARAFSSSPANSGSPVNSGRESQGQYRTVARHMR